MNLLEVKNAIAVVQPNHSVLIYGPPKMGKSRLAGTAAKIKEISRIWYFDGENGSETLLNMGLTNEELAKVTLFKMRDTPGTPIFIETMLKAFTSKAPINICDMHGKVDCVECKTANRPSTRFFLPECTHNDLVIVDTGSQLADSAMAALCLGKDSMFKPGWDEYGIQGKWLSDILSVTQQAVYTNFVFLTHEICVENDEKKDFFYPLMGTKAFSMKVGKYFGTVVYVHKKLNKHAAGSSSTYLGDRITGSRVNAKIESGEADMRTILIGGGILRSGVLGNVAPTPIVVDTTTSGEVPVASALDIRKDLDAANAIRTEIKQENNKPLSFAERMALTKKKP